MIQMKNMKCPSLMVKLRNLHVEISYDEWEKRKIEEWWVTFGKMWLDGSYDRENRTFPYKIINPDAPDYMFVEARGFTRSR